MPRYMDLVQYAFAFEQAVVTPHTFATMLVPVSLGYYIMAILVQLPQTSLYRVALLPVVLWLAFRAAMSLDFSRGHADYGHVNQAFVLTMVGCAMRSTVWAFVQRPYIRLPIRKPGNTTPNDRNGDTSIMVEHGAAISSAMWNALDLAVNFREIGWNRLQKTYIPTPYFRVESRLIFSALSLCQAIFLVLVSCILRGTIHSLGPDTFARPEGGTIFDPSLPPAERYMKSSVVTLLSGVITYTLVNGFYQLHAAIWTIVLQQYPSQWPPLFDSPWLSTSLASFWGRRWHQIYRECFVTIGSKPMEILFGRVGALMGAFAVSGILHDIGSRAMGRGADTLPMVGFFLLHGVGVTMEHAWKQVTGRRVGGVIGWLWVASWFILTGHLIVDIWGRRGVIGLISCPVALPGLPACF